MNQIPVISLSGLLSDDPAQGQLTATTLGKACQEVGVFYLVGGQMHLLVPDVRRTAVRAIRLTDEGLVETQQCRLEEPILGPQGLTDFKLHFD